MMTTSERTNFRLPRAFQKRLEFVTSLRQRVLDDVQRSSSLATASTANSIEPSITDRLVDSEIAEAMSRADSLGVSIPTAQFFADQIELEVHQGKKMHRCGIRLLATTIVFMVAFGFIGDQLLRNALAVHQSVMQLPAPYWITFLFRGRWFLWAAVCGLLLWAVYVAFGYLKRTLEAKSSRSRVVQLAGYLSEKHPATSLNLAFQILPPPTTFPASTATGQAPVEAVFLDENGVFEISPRVLQAEHLIVRSDQREKMEMLLRTAPVVYNYLLMLGLLFLYISFVTITLGWVLDVFLQGTRLP